MTERFTPEWYGEQREICTRPGVSPVPWEIFPRDLRCDESPHEWPEDEFLQFDIHGLRQPMGRGMCHGADAEFIVAATANYLAVLERLEALETGVERCTD